MTQANQLQTILRAEVYGSHPTNQVISHLSTDTRTLINPAQSLFFAIQGPRQNGHSFIATAYQKGVRHFVIDQSVHTESYPLATFFRVEHSIQALQQLAQWKRSQFQLPIIGITGSNAKTIIKEWLFQLLREDYQIVRSPKSFNSQIGVPLSVWQIEAHHELGIFEAGISEVGEMEKLQSIIDCSIGLFTNIGEAHQSGFQSLTQKIEEKAKLFKQTEVLFCCRDHPEIYAYLSQQYGKRVVSWSSNGVDANWQFTLHSKQAKTEVEYEGQTLLLPFSDRASVENALHCLAILLYLNIPFEAICHRMAYLPSIEMRLELKPGINQCQLINDSYTFDLTALEVALDFMQKQGGQLTRTVILGNPINHSDRSTVGHQRLADLLRNRNIDRVIAIGAGLAGLKDYLPSSIDQRFFTDTDSFLQHFSQLPFQRELILVKGARSLAFERIVYRLSQHNHSTRLEINLSALVHNLQVYTSLLQPQTKRMVMVKAAAYGSGSDEVSRLMEFHQVDYLAVAYTDEGVALRQAGIKTPIVVLNPEIETFSTLFAFDLEPEIYSFDLLQQMHASYPKLPIHLKLDTGMHRLGFLPKEVPSLVDWLKDHPEIQVASIFSHLAASEAPSEEVYTRQQADLFQSMAQQIMAHLPNKPLLHLLNSSGISRYPEYQFDMVRIGIGLYGADATQPELQIVAQLKSFITQIKSLPAKATIGYGRTGKKDTPSRIAVVGIGYADGLLRLAGQGRFSVGIRGQKAPTIGNICMDMCMVDITHLPEVQVGDEVVVYGEDPTIQELANALETIPYEVLTNVSPRVRRVYVE